jgi:hypothetical protein
MKAHRREAKNTALIECVQVAAEKAKWPIRDEFKRMSSRAGGGGARAEIPHTRLDGGLQVPARPVPQRTSYDRPLPSIPPAPQSRPLASEPRATAPEPPRPAPPAPPPPAPPPTPANVQHGAARFSSVFGTRRR